ncbi:MAG: GNAT family N-acetyltransferase [Pyrinomonadaceae bacterium]
MTTIIQAVSEAEVAEARDLFREYESWLGLSLCFQNFDDEVSGLPGKYSPPDGRLLLAYTGEGELAGCVAMRKLEDGICEMKRLFVRDAYRGRRVGVALLEKVIDEARLVGYNKLRLDTYPPRMQKAAALYERYGFREIAPYYHNPYGDTLFMELAL